MTETVKYIIRFGVVLLIVIPILYFTQGASAPRIVFYKLALAFTGVGTAELVWGVFFKPVYGLTEKLPNEEKLSIMVFRGLLYAALILAFTLGL
jgi:uncharacterized membrane protein YgaE (UPF0421/DUF939 family)